MSSNGTSPPWLTPPIFPEPCNSHNIKASILQSSSCGCIVSSQCFDMFPRFRPSKFLQQQELIGYDERAHELEKCSKTKLKRAGVGHAVAKTRCTCMARLAEEPPEKLWEAEGRRPCSTLPLPQTLDTSPAGGGGRSCGSPSDFQLMLFVKHSRS